MSAAQYLSRGKRAETRPFDRNLEKNLGFECTLMLHYSCASQRVRLHKSHRASPPTGTGKRIFQMLEVVSDLGCDEACKYIKSRVSRAWQVSSKLPPSALPLNRLQHKRATCCQPLYSLLRPSCLARKTRQLVRMPACTEVY